MHATTYAFNKSTKIFLKNSLSSSDFKELILVLKSSNKSILGLFILSISYENLIELSFLENDFLEKFGCIAKIEEPNYPKYKFNWEGASIVKPNPTAVKRLLDMEIY